MKHILKIQGRGIGKTKEAIELTIKLLKKNPETKIIHIVANKKNHKGYTDGLEKAGIKFEMIEQTEPCLVLKCKK